MTLTIYGGPAGHDFDCQAEFEERLAAGEIVEVSDEVALQQLAGQEAEAKRARRKAAKAARKRNR